MKSISEKHYISAINSELHFLPHARHDRPVTTHLAATLQLNYFFFFASHSVSRSHLSLSPSPSLSIYMCLSDGKTSLQCSARYSRGFSLKQKRDVSNNPFLIPAEMRLPCPEPACFLAHKNKVNWLCSWLMCERQMQSELLVEWI